MNADHSTINFQKPAIRWLLIPSLVLIVVLQFDLLPFLRGNDEWRWSLRPYEATARLLIPFATLGFYVLLGARWLKGFEREDISRRYERWFVLFVIVAAPVIQLSLAAAVSRMPLLEFFGPTVSTHNSGYFTTAVSTPDLHSLLANYPVHMPQLPIHAQSHPPGPVIAHWLSWHAFQALPALADAIGLPLRALQCHNPGFMALDNSQIASASLGMLLPLLGGLAVWPLYAFAKRVASVRVAAITALLFPVLPLFALWMSQWDQTYPLLLFLSLYLAHTGLEKHSWWRIFAAGVSLSIASFFSVGNFVLMVIVGGYGVAWWAAASRMYHNVPLGNPTADRRSRLKPAVSAMLKIAVAFALGCASIWLLYWLFYGVNPLRVISTGSRLAFESTTGNRSYGVWLLGNPIDFLVFLGFPIVLLLFYNLIKRTTFPKSLRPLAVAACTTLLLLWLSGIVRGEAGRLWMYFGPLLVLIGVGWSEGHYSLPVTRHASGVTLYVSLIALLAAQLLMMNIRWLVNDSFLNAPPERSVVLSPPLVAHPAAAEFADQIALQGYAARSTANALEVDLVWQALAQPQHAYTVFVHVFNAHGQQVGQQDNMPMRDLSPTSCWQPGEYVTDPYSILLTTEAREPFSVVVGLYRGDTGARLPRSDAQGDSVTLAVP